MQTVQDLVVQSGCGTCGFIGSLEAGLFLQGLEAKNDKGTSR